MNLDQFRSIAVLGRGHFGKVGSRKRSSIYFPCLWEVVLEFQNIFKTGLSYNSEKYKSCLNRDTIEYLDDITLSPSLFLFLCSDSIWNPYF